MRVDAEKHLAKAKGYLDKGEGFYRKAATEIVAAKEADHTLSNREIGEWFGRSAEWVAKLVKWSTIADPGTAPFSGTAEAKGRGTMEAKRVLREAPLEQVEQIISSLPPERQQAVAAAAGNQYMKARQDYSETEARLTSAERKGREAAASSLTEPARRAGAGFAALGIVGHLEQALDELRELVADASITADHMRQIETAFYALAQEFEVARAMAGLSEEVGA